MFNVNSINSKSSDSVFTKVDYRQFRQHMADISSNTIKCKGFETVIFDRGGNIQAIVHAASIDQQGACHPAEYHIRTSALPAKSLWQLAA